MSNEMKRYTIKLVNIEQVGVEFFIFSFEKPKDLTFKEGQYGVFMHVDKEITGKKLRAFNFASGSKEDLLIIGTVIKAEHSDFKAKMKDLSIGDTMTVDLPMGDMSLEEDYYSIFLCACIGITPMRSMIKQLEL